MAARFLDEVVYTIFIRDMSLLVLGHKNQGVPFPGHVQSCNRPAKLRGLVVTADDWLVAI
jgi:hypothetical protein